jgi:ABC-type transport system involved in Fe-S cluster assembly fused permease/ATPase subunit
MYIYVYGYICVYIYRHTYIHIYDFICIRNFNIGFPLLTKTSEAAVESMGIDRLINKKIQKNLKNEKSFKNFKNEKNSQNYNENIDHMKSVHNLNGISYSLSRIPKDLCLSAADKRTVCSLSDILGFLVIYIYIYRYI